MTLSPRKCAIYLRISLDATGEGLAIDRQREDCERIAAERGWRVVQTYVDNSISASSRKKVRPAYDRMASDFAAGGFDALVCYDLDRLTRQPRQLEDWIDAAEERGLLLVTANGEADLSTDAGRLFARIKASVAKAEVDRKSARQRRAMVQKVASGRLPNGVRLTGYAADGSVIDHEAAFVHEIFDRFIAGDSLRALAACFNERGIPTRNGGQWSSSSIRTILLNPRYAGLAALRGEPIKDARGARVRGGWNPIVSEAIYDAVQTVLASPERKTNRQGTDRRHLGTGLYRSGECGQPVRSHNGRYRCPNAHLMRSMAQVDAAVVAVVRARLAMKDLADLLPRADDEAPAAAQRAVDELRLRLTTIQSDYDDGLIDGSRFREATEKTTKRLNEATAQLMRLCATDPVARALGALDPVAAFDSATLGVRRTVLDTLLTVSLHRAPRGRKTFDPSTVTIAWHSGEEVA